MLLLVVMVTLVEPGLVDTTLLHGLGGGVGHWHHCHQVSRPIERVVDVLKLVAGDAMERLGHIVTTIGLFKLHGR